MENVVFADTLSLACGTNNDHFQPRRLKMVSNSPQKFDIRQPLTLNKNPKIQDTKNQVNPKGQKSNDQRQKLIFCIFGNWDLEIVW